MLDLLKHKAFFVALMALMPIGYSAYSKTPNPCGSILLNSPIIESGLALQQYAMRETQRSRKEIQNYIQNQPSSMDQIFKGISDSTPIEELSGVQNLEKFFPQLEWRRFEQSNALTIRLIKIAEKSFHTLQVGDWLLIRQDGTVDYLALSSKDTNSLVSAYGSSESILSDLSESLCDSECVPFATSQSQRWETLFEFNQFDQRLKSQIDDSSNRRFTRVSNRNRNLEISYAGRIAEIRKPAGREENKYDFTIRDSVTGDIVLQRKNGVWMGSLSELAPFLRASGVLN